ncbi:MAG: hypothetical protein RR706_02950 [Muribaculaceae bacterium]
MSIAMLCCNNIGYSQDKNTLYNGINLPQQWPPRYEEPKVAGDMPVPYLKNKPSVIPVNVGRQLFVDDFLISESNMETKVYTPTFYKGNPVLEPTEKWEETIEGAPYAAPFSDGIWYDEKDNKFKMWYLAGAGMLHKGGKQTFYTGYAESLDGKKWEKVKQDIYPGTNIVDTCNRDAATIWLDRTEKDGSKRYKMFNVERRPTDKRWQFIMKYSSDGIHWSNGVAQSGDLYDRSSVFYNPFRDVWCMSMRYSTDVSSRSRSYLEAADAETAVSMAHRTRKGVADKNIVYWFTPSDKEPRHPDFPEVNPGIYNFDCIAYESIMLGQYSVWQGPENNMCGEKGIQKKNEVFLGYSRDGFHFSRPSFKPFMAVNEVDGAWNWGNMQSINGTPLIVGDSLYFYSSGRRLNKIMWDSYISTGLATLRRDGFISKSAGKEEKYLITENLSFDGKYLFVNADIRGKMYVEVLDSSGNAIKGFSKKEVKAIKKANSTKLLITDLGELTGKIIRLKFYITNGDLYSFWISPWHSGESRGYTSGGGKGLSSSGVDVPDNINQK